MRAAGGGLDFVEFEGDVLASLLGFGFVGNLTVAVEVEAQPGRGDGELVTWRGGAGVVNGHGDLMFELAGVMWGPILVLFRGRHFKF